MKIERRKHVAVAGALLILYSAFVMRHFSIDWPKAYDHPKLPGAMLALELPHDPEEFAALTDSPGAPRDIRSALWADYGFILLYGIFFVVFATAIVDERTSTAMILTTIVTALADVGENVYIFRALGEAPPTAAALRAILIFGCLKWLTFFVVVLLAAGAMQEGGMASRVAALFLRVAALVGLFAAAASFISAGARPLVQISFFEAGLTFLAIVVVFAAGALRKAPRAAAAAT